MSKRNAAEKKKPSANMTLSSKQLLGYSIVPLLILGYFAWREFKPAARAPGPPPAPTPAASDWQPKKPAHSPASAWLAVKGYVKDRLKAPTTARFPGGALTSATEFVKHAGDGVYLSVSHVDSQNAFGATIRERFAAQVTWLPDKERYRLDKLAFEGEAE